MNTQQASIKLRLAIGVAAIVASLVVSGFTALSIQGDAATTASALVERNETDLSILTIKANIAESMFPAHSYLIDGELGAKEAEFLMMLKGVRNDMERLAAGEEPDHPEQALIRNALVELDELESIQRRIFKLEDEERHAKGPALMRAMHRFQRNIQDDFDDFKLAEQTELKKLTAVSDAHNRRAVALIIAAAFIALAAALFVAYTGNEL